MRAGLFSSGFAPRLACALAYGLAALAAVSALGRHASVTASAPAVVHTAEGVATLCIESVRSVHSWEVRLDGRPLQAQRTDEHLWIGEAAITADASLVIDATPVGGESGGSAASNSLRIRIAGTAASRDHVAWCTRTWSVALPVNQLTPAPASIDPADLP